MKLPLAGCVYLLAASVAQAGVIKTLDSMSNSCVAATVGTIEKEYRSYNGTCNNEANPTWGSSGVMVGEGVQLQRWDDTAYYRDTSTLPSTRAISNAASMQPNTVSVPNSKGVSAMLMQWGQFLDHDLDLTPTGTESMPIPVDADDTPFGMAYKVSGMPFTRSVYDPVTGSGSDNPRQQLNVSTAFIDASQIYGSDKGTAMSLREMSGGRLKMDDGLLPSDMNGDFYSGDERVREQVGLTAMHTLFSREHNRIAGELEQQYRDDAAMVIDEEDLDETVYQETRKLVGAMMQSITFNEFLPALLGSSAPGAYDPDPNNPDSDIYDPDINPGIYTEFSTAAYRFGHSTLAPNLLRLDADFLPLGDPLPLEQAFFNAESLIDPAIGGVGIEPFLRGLVTQQAQEVDTLIVDALRNMLFPTMGGFDLAALNMQRGRDHGLPTYKQMRGILGLDTYEDGWNDTDLTFSADITKALKEVYGFDDLDLWIGGLAEAHHGDSLLGELFTMIVADQFNFLREGDRFWFERAGMFEPAWMEFVESSTLSAVMARNGFRGSSRVEITGLQANVFYVVPAPGVLALLTVGFLGLQFRNRSPSGSQS